MFVNLSIPHHFDDSTRHLRADAGDVVKAVLLFLLGLLIQLV